MSEPLSQILARKIAKEANTCCYRSDGYEERIQALALSVINEAVAAERERCAKLCEETGAFTDELEMAQMCAAAIRAASAQHLDTSPAICDNPRT